MSTNSAVLFSAPEIRNIRGTLTSKTENGAIFKDLPDRNLSISVRGLSPAADVPIVYKWMCAQYAGAFLSRDAPPGELEDSYASMIESDFSHPFMGLINEAPVCQVNIYKTLQDAISLYYDARPGDYGLQLVATPLAIQDNMAVVLRAFLDYFFTFPEVSRIVADIETKNEWTNTLFKMAGFRFHKKINIPYKTANLYSCTRDSLRRRL